MSSKGDGHDAIVVRIVFDGPASSGKTTNLRRLGGVFSPSRRSELISPGEQDGETLYFDWMRIEGGRVGGQALRYLFLSAPGNPAHEDRRERLLEVADVVVFVCDSSRERVRWAERRFALLRERYPADRIVVQANKQDLADALTPDEVASVLGTGPDVALIAAAAEAGEGLKETAFAAMRLGATHVQKALRAGAPVARRVYEPDEILTSMGDGVSIEDRSQAEQEHDMNQDAAVVATGTSLPFAKTASDRPPSTRRKKNDLPRRDRSTDNQWRNTVPWTRGPGDAGRPPFPRHDVASTHIWPGVEGRGILAELEVDRAQWSRGKDERVIAKVGGWCLTTSRNHHFTAEAEARAALMQLARQKKALRHLSPDDAVVALASDRDESFWLWSITRWEQSLGEEMVLGLREGETEALEGAALAFADAVLEALRMTLVHRVVLHVHPSTFARTPSGLTYIADDVEEGDRVPGAVHALFEVADDLERYPNVLSRFIDRFAQGLQSFIESDLEQLGMARDLDAERPLTESSRTLQSRLRNALEQVASHE